MENKKLFIRNLSFKVTEADVKGLLSKYGTVTDIKMPGKKGYAFVEMSSVQEAENAAQKLDRTIFRDREIRINPEMKGAGLKPESAGKYKERGKFFSGKRGAEGRNERARSEKKKGPGGAALNSSDRQPGQSKGEYTGEYSARFRKMSASLANTLLKSEEPAPSNRQAGHGTGVRQNSSHRGRLHAERPADNKRSGKKVLVQEKQPRFSGQPALDDSEDCRGNNSQPSGNRRAVRAGNSGKNRPLNSSRPDIRGGSGNRSRNNRRGRD